MKLFKFVLLSIAITFPTYVNAGYSVRELFLPSGITNVSPTDINDNNEVVGWVNVPSGTTNLSHIIDTVGIYWNGQGSYFIIDDSGHVRSSKAFAINNKGSVVGELVDSTGTIQGLFRSNHQLLNLIGNFNTYSEALDINDNDVLIGNVVGLNAAYPQKSRAFRIGANDALEYIDTLSVLYPTGNITAIDASQAYKINNSGRILTHLWGYSTYNGAYLGPISGILLKHSVTGSEQLRTPTWHPDTLNNNNRMVAGVTPPPTCLAFDYDTSTGTTSAMPEFRPSGVCTPLAINDSNSVVGQFEFVAGVKSAFVFDGAMHDLKDLITSCGQRITLTKAIGINKNGVILASGNYVNDGANVKHAFILTPSGGSNESCVLSVDVPTADVALTLTDTPDPAVIGQTVTYTTTVRNNGPSPTGVTITGTLVPCNITTLAVNETTSCTSSVAVNGTSLPAQNMSVSSNVFDPNGGNNSASQNTTVNTPDLIIEAISASQSATNVLVNDRIKNSGTLSAGATTTKYYLSSNNSYDTTDTLLCSRSVGALNVGESSPTAGTIQTVCAAPNITTGMYYVIAMADANSQIIEKSENNNSLVTCCTVIGIGIDLVPVSMSASRVAGSSTLVTITDAVLNRGTKNAGSFAVRYYLSKNITFSSDDLALVTSSGTACSRTISSLNSGVTGPSTSTTCYKSSTAVSNTNYYVLAVADSGNVVTEYNESNNVKASTTQVKW